jgi:hypothetical protein
VGMRRERHGLDYEMRAQVVRVARKHRVGMNERELDMQLECSQFFEQFDNSCLVVPTCQAHVCIGRQQPTLWSISFAKVAFMHVIKQW